MPDKNKDKPVDIAKRMKISQEYSGSDPSGSDSSDSESSSSDSSREGKKKRKKKAKKVKKRVKKQKKNKQMSKFCQRDRLCKLKSFNNCFYIRNVKLGIFVV